MHVAARATFSCMANAHTHAGRKDTRHSGQSAPVDQPKISRTLRGTWGNRRRWSAAAAAASISKYTRSWQQTARGEYSMLRGKTDDGNKQQQRATRGGGPRSEQTTAPRRSAPASRCVGVRLERAEAATREAAAGAKVLTGRVGALREHLDLAALDGRAAERGRIADGLCTRKLDVGEAVGV